MTATIVLDDLTREVPAVRDLVNATQSDLTPANTFWNNWGSFGRSAAPRVVTE
ncbi:hypothetical protein ACIGXM_14420 [Kitasatospora sp. NPDC052896]|uniref:hypothetical protein n=1 Tax=Kitasatospora sp. NPDC052896 TaxID=3364061 RepID=UPI0037C759AE